MSVAYYLKTIQQNYHNKIEIHASIREQSYNKTMSQKTKTELAAIKFVTL